MRWWRCSMVLMAVLAMFPTRVNADSSLTVQVYKYENGPPELIDDPEICEGSMTSTDQIDFDWSGDIVAGCDYEQVVVHFSGVITVPEMALLVVAHDDGAVLKLNGDYWIDAWRDQGCSYDMVWVEPGEYDFDLWFYENGGGACLQLLWADQNQYWYEPVPASWFSSAPSPTTTSTTTSTTTTSTTTTTEPPTTTTEVTTSLPPEVPTTTTQPESPTSAPSTTEGTTTSTWVQTTTSTTQPQISSTTAQIETVPATTSTQPLTIPPTQTTSTTTTEAPTTVATQTTTESPTASDPPTPGESQPISDEAFSELIQTTFDEPLTDAQLDDALAEIFSNPITNEQFDELISVLEGDVLSGEQVNAVVAKIVENEITPDQASNLATSSEVLSVITSDLAAEVFDAVDVGSLDANTGAEIVNAVQTQSEEIRNEFEQHIDVFAGVFDTYVPIGSVVDVSTRRTLVAVTATLGAMVIPAPTTTTRKGK